MVFLLPIHLLDHHHGGGYSLGSISNMVCAMRICRDCKFFDENWNSGREGGPRCQYPSQGKEPVHGTLIKGLCAENRRPEGKCGYDANWFEQRTR